jgi:hypothetical protein
MPRKNTGAGERSKPKPPSFVIVDELHAHRDADGPLTRGRKTVKPIDKQSKDDPAVSRVSRSRASGRGGRGR